MHIIDSQRVQFFFFSIRPSKDEWVSIASSVWAKVLWIESIDGQIQLKIVGFHESMGSLTVP